MSTLIRNSFMPGKYNNYLIGGNLCNAFALGEIGSTEDFFIVGAEPSDESHYPMITANILDSEGRVLFRLVKNILVFNPGHCSKIIGDILGYEINDSEGNMVFRISTKFMKIPQLREPCYITTIEANFFNKEGEHVFLAEAGGENERVEAKCKSFFGFPGGLVIGYTENEIEMVRIALITHGAVHQILSGSHKEEEIELDGKLLKDAEIQGCKIIIKEGNFIIGNNLTLISNDFIFKDKASQIHRLIQLLNNQKK